MNLGDQMAEELFLQLLSEAEVDGDSRETSSNRSDPGVTSEQSQSSVPPGGSRCGIMPPMPRVSRCEDAEGLHVLPPRPHAGGTGREEGQEGTEAGREVSGDQGWREEVKELERDGKCGKEAKGASVRKGGGAGGRKGSGDHSGGGREMGW